MNPSKIVSLLALCGTLGLLAGCTTETESHLVTAPPPPAPGTAPAPAQVVVVSQQPQAVATAVVAGPASSYIVVQAPPAPPVPEAIPPRPSPANVWVTGYWTWQTNRYAWMAGHWEVPPHSGAVWVNPRVESEAGNFRFYEGYWN